jgi:hypothetical protein
MRNHVISRCILVLLTWLQIPLIVAFSVQNKSIDRSKFISTVTSGMLIAPLTSAAKTTQPTPEEDISIIREAYSALTVLLENWEKATVECIFADVPRELLEQKNKEQLLEKASVFALFDKSTSVVSCKMTNKVVRDYIGVTGKGPLVNIDKRLLRRSVVDTVDVDDWEMYYSEVENFQRAISRASTASYAAGVADFDSMNNFQKGSQKDSGDSNLDQAQSAIKEAKQNIASILSLLDSKQ